MDYIIIYFGNRESLDETVYRVTEKEMFEWIDKAKFQNLKISVYKIGECLLDWS